VGGAFAAGNDEGVAYGNDRVEGNTETSVGQDFISVLGADRCSDRLEFISKLVRGHFYRVSDRRQHEHFLQGKGQDKKNRVAHLCRT
jgi:hypothetical protein